MTAYRDRPNVNDEVVPISALEHYCYCPRQAALIYVDGVWRHNAATARGAVRHRRADEPGGRRHRSVLVMRAVPLWSERLGLSGRADLVEQRADGSLCPVEYKTGTRHGVAAHVQVCAQAMCLEEMVGQAVDTAEISYSAHRRRDVVVLDQELRLLTLDVIESVRALRGARRLPPAPNDDRCRACQLLHHCQPSMTARPAAVRRYLDEEVLSCRS